MARSKHTDSRASRAQRRARLRKPRQRRSGSMLWGTVIALVVVLGVGGIWLVRGDSQAAAGPPHIGDHWHSYLGINICGQWLPNWPEFNTVDGSPNVRTGIHSHGDGNVHIHPEPGETGDNATLGRFFGNGGGSVSGDSIRIWDGTEYRSGDDCETGEHAGEAGVVQWTVDGVVQDGSPGDYRLRNGGEIIAVYFLPEGAELTEQPGARENLIAPAAVAPGEAPGVGEPDGVVPVPDESTSAP